MRRSDALPVCRGQRIPDARDALTSDDADQASAAVLTVSFTARATKTLSSKRTIRLDQPWRVEGMSDTTTAYLVSLGIIGAGAIWIDAGTTLCITIGVPTIVVGLISLLAELRD
jgi:hypothetical protein